MKRMGEMEIICYSCGRGERPENSLEGIRHCQSVNSKWRIEMDVQMTADNQLVLFHDLETTRTTGEEFRINERTLKELQKLNAGFNFKIEETYPYRESPVRIPQLKDVFNEFPKAKLLLDIHTNDPKVIEVFIDLIEAECKNDDFIVVSKYDEVVQKMRTKKPNWTYGVPANEAKNMLYSSFLYLDGLFPIKSDVLMLPRHYGGLTVLSKRVVNHAQKRNKALWAWIYESKDSNPSKFKAVASIDELEDLRKLGVSGVFTEYPQKLSSELP